MISHRARLWTPFLLLVSTVVDAATLTHEFLENSNLLTGCRFSLGRNVYDLCPLMLERATREIHGTAWVLEEGVNSLARRLYTLTLSGEANDRQCPKGTWVCMRETRGSDSPQHEVLERTTHTPIAGKLRHESSLVDDGVNAVASIFDSDHNPPSPLNLFLNGGVYDDRPRYARIEFICDPSSEDTDPLFTGETLGVHSFAWSTKHGCPIVDSHVDTSALKILDEESNDTLPNPEEAGDDGEQELLDPKIPPKASRRWVASVLLLTCAFLITISIILASPHTRFVLISRLKSLATTLRLPTALCLLPRPFRFRASENSLVRWAQEDMSLAALDEEEGRGDVDVDEMVNGGIADEDWDWEGADEYIPLKSHSSRSKRNYGSALGAARAL
ncbi:hypothetical protein LshimejAT787_0905010 [Lyophyllum shimeji]|uniref:Autophagy-related protein 27 n=1 Tax=Lyophyllum shimeji TaxID=47721 RepID=A0A9P3PT83_LYOSH|nr:hypothetical protein LshimejAT787_0905010 [Lyophyllum shimeji]